MTHGFLNATSNFTLAIRALADLKDGKADGHYTAANFTQVINDIDRLDGVNAADKGDGILTRTSLQRYVTEFEDDGDADYAHTLGIAKIHADLAQSNDKTEVKEANVRRLAAQIEMRERDLDTALENFEPLPQDQKTDDQETDAWPGLIDPGFIEILPDFPGVEAAHREPDLPKIPGLVMPEWPTDNLKPAPLPQIITLPHLPEGAPDWQDLLQDPKTQSAVFE